MSALNSLKGASLEGIWVDAPAHSVTLALRMARATPVTEYTLILDGVTDFSFFDETARPWAGAEVTGVRVDHDPDSMRLDFSLGSEAAGLAVRCAKAALHKARQTT
ncbi:MAG: hypothetical protein M0026_06665 [Nocardiopsaceae bacterium]|nr:hypothetical protein [Nocardiopsaceae bacterium]